MASPLLYEVLRYLKCIKINHSFIDHPQMQQIDHICINKVLTNVLTKLTIID